MSRALGRRPRVALATSEDWPQLSPDDAGIAPALEAAGMDAEIATWTDAAADWGRYDAVVVRSCWDYHDDLPRWMRWIDRVAAGASAAAGPRLWNPPAVLRWNARKIYLDDLVARGVPIVPTVFCGAEVLASAEAFDRVRGHLPWDELVAKPAVSAGARHTHRARRDDRAAWRSIFTTERAAWIRRGPLLVQPFLPEIAREGEWSLLYFGGVFSHAVLKRPAPGDFRVQERYGGSMAVAPPTPELLSVAAHTLAAAADAVAMRDPAQLLYARVDLVMAGGAPLLVELEVTEPALFFTASPAGNGAVARFAEAVARTIE